MSIAHIIYIIMANVPVLPMDVDKDAVRNKFHQLLFGFDRGGALRDEKYYGDFKASPEAVDANKGSRNMLSPGMHAEFIAVFTELGEAQETPCFPLVDFPDMDKAKVMKKARGCGFRTQTLIGGEVILEKNLHEKKVGACTTAGTQQKKQKTESKIAPLEWSKILPSHGVFPHLDTVVS